MGLIARYIHKFLAGTDWSFDEIGVYDLSADSAAGFRGYLERSGAANRITVHDTAEQLIRSSDMVVFATIAGEPHVKDLSWFDHNPLVLHVSLRDLAPRSSSPQRTSSMMLSIASRPTLRRIWRSSSPATGIFCKAHWAI